MRRLMPVLPLALLFVACARSAGPAPAQPAPAPVLDPVGVFDMTLEMEGNQFGATVTIRGEPGAYTGVVESDMGSESIANVTVNGMELKFVVSVPDMTIYFRMLFDGDEFVGDFGSEQFGGGLAGKRRVTGG